MNQPGANTHQPTSGGLCGYAAEIDPSGRYAGEAIDLLMEAHAVGSFEGMVLEGDWSGVRHKSLWDQMYGPAGALAVNAKTPRHLGR